MTRKPFYSCCFALLLPVAAGVAMCGASGCRQQEQKEKIIDIHTDDTDVEVERSKKDGSLDVEVKRKTDKSND